MELFKWTYLENVQDTYCFNLDTLRSLGEVA